MSGRWVKVHLVDRREICSNSIYDYYIDEALVKSFTDTPRTLKKIGLAIQLLTSHQQTSFRTGAVYCRRVIQQNNTFTFILEYNGLLEVHSHISEPEETILKDVTLTSEVQPALAFPDCNLDLLNRALQNNIFPTTGKQPLLCLTPLIDREQKSHISPAQEHCENTLRLLGARAAEQANFFQELNTLNHHNQTTLQQIRADIAKAQTGIPEEALGFWTTAHEKLTQCEALARAEEEAVTGLETELQLINERTQRHLISSYETFQGNETGFLKPIQTAIIQVLQDTALSECTNTLTYYNNQLTPRLLQEFNEKFAGVARLIQRDVAKNGKPAILLEWDKELAQKSLHEIAALINHFLTVCSNYLDWSFKSSAKLLFGKLVNAHTTLKDNAILSDTQFGWDEKVTQTNAHALYDSKHLEASLSNYPVHIRKHLRLSEHLEKQLSTLPPLIQEAAAQTTLLGHKLTGEQTKAALIQQTVEAATAESEALYAEVTQNQANCLTLAKTLVPAADYTKLEGIYTLLSERIASLQSEAKIMTDFNERIQNTRSVRMASQLISEQAPHLAQFTAHQKTIQSKCKQLAKVLQVLQTQEQKNQAEAAKAREDALRVANERLTQTVANQRALAHQATVIDIARKIGHVLAAVTFWNKQRPWGGGVAVENPAGGEALNVPHGISEMITQKKSVNFTTLTYDQAVNFIANVKACAAKAKQRSGLVFCCFAVRNETTTGALYTFLNAFDIEKPPSNIDQRLNEINPDWQNNYGIITNTTPLLSDQPLDASPRAELM
jgi:hypothetical protein